MLSKLFLPRNHYNEVLGCMNHKETGNSYMTGSAYINPIIMHKHANDLSAASETLVDIH